MKALVFLLLLPYVLAFELPFSLSALFVSKASRNTTIPSSSPTPRIAIIGAGAGGSSAAFWISKAKERFGLDVQVDVYEAADYIGGRSTIVHPYNNKSLSGIELGASVFVELNKNLWRAADEFNLTRRNLEDTYETGIWDGRNVFVSFSGSWWDTLTLLWRYGVLSPRRTENAVRALSSRMLDVYRPESPKWDSISSLAEVFGWTEVVNSTAADFFTSQGVSDKYIFEVIQAATRVNYDQNTDEINGLSAAVSMVASGARDIEGGNYQIFEQFLNRSGANVYLNTKVKSISEASYSSGWSLRSTRGTIGYKAIILAAPFHLSGIAVPPSISEQIPDQPYMHLHVTLLSTTTAHPNPEYFGMPAGSKVPRVMLTTKERPNSRERPEFNSLTYHGPIREGEWSVKIFSDRRLSDEWLDNMFQGQVKWVTRKEWDAYPKLSPTTKFPPVKLDRGFYYVNAFEPFMSAMETQTVSSRNVVDFLLREEFNSGICPPTSDGEEAQDPLLVSTPPSKASENFVLGFDC